MRATSIPRTLHKFIWTFIQIRMRRSELQKAPPPLPAHSGKRRISVTIHGESHRQESANSNNDNNKNIYDPRNPTQASAAVTARRLRKERSLAASAAWKNTRAGSRRSKNPSVSPERSGVQSGLRLIYESGPASSSSYLFVCGLVVTPRAAGPRVTYNDIFVSEMSRRDASC